MTISSNNTHRFDFYAVDFKERNFRFQCWFKYLLVLGRPLTSWVKNLLPFFEVAVIVISSFGEITKDMRELMAITKALSDPNRVRILLSLRRGELCVCQITELFGLATSTVSKHLSILNQAGLILSRKTERWVYYRLPDKAAPVVVREALDWIHKSLSKTDEANADALKLKKVLKMDLADICRRRC